MLNNLPQVAIASQRGAGRIHTQILLTPDHALNCSAVSPETYEMEL